MHPSKRAQIIYLKADKALTEVSNKYADFADVRNWPQSSSNTQKSIIMPLS